MNATRVSGGAAHAPVHPRRHSLWCWVAVIDGVPHTLGGNTGGLLAADNPAAAAKLRDRARDACNQAWGPEMRIELRKYIWDGQPG